MLCDMETAKIATLLNCVTSNLQLKISRMSLWSVPQACNTIDLLQTKGRIHILVKGDMLSLSPAAGSDAKC